MKKLHILLVLLFITVTTFAQSTVTITGSSINVNGTTYNVGSVYYVENYTNGTLQIKDRFSTTLILGYEKAINVINGTTGVVFTSQAASEAYLIAGGVGSGGSSSSSGGASLPVISNPVNTTVTVGTTSTQLLAADATGYVYIVQNLSTATVSIWLINGATATVGNGIELPAGASYQSPYRITGAVNAIVSTGTQNVQVQKFQ